MSRVITVMNMKGGVGKTTLTLNVGGLIASRSLGGQQPLKVLLIDYDPQFNLSQACLPSTKYFAAEKARKTTLSILVDSGVALNPYQLQVAGNHSPPTVGSLATTILKSESSHLDLVPSTLDLMYVALGSSNTAQIHSMEERFEKFILDARVHYDLVFIDCHPAGSLFTKTSLANSDFVVIPVMAQKYAVRGIGLMMEFIKAKKAGSAGASPLIIFNAVPRAGTTSEETAIRADPRYGAFCMNNTLKWYKAFGDINEGAGFVWQSGAPYSTQAFQNLAGVARELRGKVGI